MKSAVDTMKALETEFLDTARMLLVVVNVHCSISVSLRTAAHPNLSQPTICLRGCMNISDTNCLP